MFISITQLRRLAHGFSIFLSIIMGIMLLVTSSLMVDIYVKYCDNLEDESHHYNNYYYYFYYRHNNNNSPSSCGEDERPFVVLPALGFCTMIIWVRCLWSRDERIYCTKIRVTTLYIPLWKKYCYCCKK